jgi:hypothetical protein
MGQWSSRSAPRVTGQLLYVCGTSAHERVHSRVRITTGAFAVSAPSATTLASTHADGDA